MCLWSSSGLESAILNFSFRSAHTVFPMCHMDRNVKPFQRCITSYIIRRRKISWVFGGLMFYFSLIHYFLQLCTVGLIPVGASRPWCSTVRVFYTLLLTDFVQEFVHWRINSMQILLVIISTKWTWFSDCLTSVWSNPPLPLPCLISTWVSAVPPRNDSASSIMPRSQPHKICLIFAQANYAFHHYGVAA